MRIMVYEYVETHAETVADLLDRIAVSGEDIMEIWQRLWLDEVHANLDEDLRNEIDFLFTYELREDFKSAGVVKLVESGLSSTATRPMLETPPGAWTLWAEIGRRVGSSVLGAHVADVLLTSQTMTNHEHAALTVSLYLKSADHAGVSAHHAALALARANDIARSRRMTEELSVRSAMQLRVGDFSYNAETSGPALTLLAALSVPPRGGIFQNGERESIREQLLALKELSPTLIDEMSRTLARLAENAPELETARRWHVNQYLTLAGADESGMWKMQHAQIAADLASSYGIVDLRDAAILVMQSVDHDSMGWKTSGFNLPISKNTFRAHLRRYRRARSWDYALVIFLASASPSGPHEENIKTAERAAAGSIRALFSRTVYGKHGLPERSNTDFLAEEITRAETMRLSISAIFLAVELEHLRDRFSPPPADQIAGVMKATFSADETLSELFAQSLVLHWSGKYSDSARLSIPLIEKAARGLLLKLDEPLYRTQRGESPGRFPAMDFYVEALANRNLDADWVRALRGTLLSPGMNLRNMSAHGFTMTFSETQSALLLRLAGLFCSMPGEVEQSDLEEPTKPPPGRFSRRPHLVWM
jgi:hypothetical protein